MLDPKFDGLPGVEYYEVETDQGTFRFAQGRAGVLPELLKDLATFRKAAKKKMADAKARGDSFAASLFNGQQLAFKIVMNSAYGCVGLSVVGLEPTPSHEEMIAHALGVREKGGALEPSALTTRPYRRCSPIFLHAGSAVPTRASYQQSPLPPLSRQLAGTSSPRPRRWWRR